MGEYDIFEKVARNKAIGTAFVGYIKASYSELKAVFGQPYSGSGDNKVRAEWVLKFPDGTIATIYDYRETTPLKEFVDWHIGGTSKKAISWVKKAIAL